MKIELIAYYIYDDQLTDKDSGNCKVLHRQTPCNKQALSLAARYCSGRVPAYLAIIDTDYRNKIISFQGTIKISYKCK